MIVVFYILILLFSVIIHEVSHGVVALKLGDTTARDAGRLTLNPLKHIDPFGSVILPLALYLTGGRMFGWAKPVPYDPRYFKHPKSDSGLVALAGPLSNFALAVIFAIFVRIVVAIGITSEPLANLFIFLNIFVAVNLGLALFNLIPIPPLDGSGVLFMFLPQQAAGFELFLRRYGIVILFIIVYSGAQFLGPVIDSAHMALIGGKAAAFFQ